MKSHYNNVTIDAATGHETFTILYQQEKPWLGLCYQLVVPRMHSSPRVCTLVLFILLWSCSCRNELRKSLAVALSRVGAPTQRVWATFWSAHQRFFKLLWFVLPYVL